MEFTLEDIEIPKKFRVSNIIPASELPIGIVSDHIGLNQGRKLSNRINWIQVNNCYCSDDFNDNKGVRITFFTDSLSPLFDELRSNGFNVLMAGEKKPKIEVEPVKEKQPIPLLFEEDPIFKTIEFIELSKDMEEYYPELSEKQVRDAVYKRLKSKPDKPLNNNGFVSI